MSLSIIQIAMIYGGAFLALLGLYCLALWDSKRPRNQKALAINQAKILRGFHDLLIELAQSSNPERAYFARQRLSKLYALERAWGLGPFAPSKPSPKAKRIQIQI